MRILTAVVSFALLTFAACRVSLPPATEAPGHGLERVFIEALGME